MSDPAPVHDTLVEILRQLNQAEVRHEGATTEQALELGEIESRLAPFLPVRSGAVRVAVALGLLVRNQLVEPCDVPGYSWQRQRDVARRYRITADGKRYLLTQIDRDDRVA